jgi:hypothetical protein
MTAAIQLVDNTLRELEPLFYTHFSHGSSLHYSVVIYDPFPR